MNEYETYNPEVCQLRHDIQDNKIIASWSGKLSDLPNDAIPTEDAMLHPSLEALIKLKAPGSAYRLGLVPVDAFRSLFDRACAAMCKFVDHVSPEDRNKYQLDVQQVAFNSIEISFRPTLRNPDEMLLFKEIDTGLPRIEGLFTEGMKWLASRGEHKLPPADEKVIQDAMRELAPKQGSQIQLIEVSGRAIGDQKTPISLTPAVRREISAKTRPPKTGAIERIGRIRELDVDALTFQLRNIKDHPDEQHVIFNFSVEHRRDVYRYLDEETLVKASGESEKGNRFRLVDLTDAAESQ